MKQEYTYWKDEEMWLGYFDESPDYQQFPVSLFNHAFQ